MFFSGRQSLLPFHYPAFTPSQLNPYRARYLRSRSASLVVRRRVRETLKRMRPAADRLALDRKSTRLNSSH